MFRGRRLPKADKELARRELVRAGEEAQEALERAKEAHQRWETVHDISQKMAKHREENHLAELLIEVLRGRR